MGLESCDPQSTQHSYYDAFNGVCVACSIDLVSVDVPSPSHGGVDPIRIERVAPNPFALDTAIRYALASGARVRLSIVDPAGRRVRRLQDGMRPSGVHDFAWDGRDDGGAPVAAGVYFVEIASAGHRASQRELLLR
jgi:FlgD Ig-like domain